jgi:anti-sigma B factor antagonist
VTDLTVEIADDDGESVLRLFGELDIDSVGSVREKVQERLAGDRPRTFTVDLAGLTFIDSSGLGLLIEIRRLALAAEIAFAMINVASGPARVIAIAGLTETFGLPAPQGPSTGS